jgi:hypothetical protein
LLGGVAKDSKTLPDRASSLSKKAAAFWSAAWEGFGLRGGQSDQYSLTLADNQTEQIFVGEVE